MKKVYIKSVNCCYYIENRRRSHINLSYSYLCLEDLHEGDFVSFDLGVGVVTGVGEVLVAKNGDYERIAEAFPYETYKEYKRDNALRYNYKFCKKISEAEYREIRDYSCQPQTATRPLPF